MAPTILFNKRTTNKAERRPRKIITKDLLLNTKPPSQDYDELSPLEMEKNKFVVKSPSSEGGTTPETVDSMIMTFSDDSFDDDDDDEDVFGNGNAHSCQLDPNWWEVPTPGRNNTTTNRMKEEEEEARYYNNSMTPFSKLALESTGRRLALSPLDANRKFQPLLLPDHHRAGGGGSSIQPIKLNMKDKRRNNHQDSNSSSSKCAGTNSPFLFSNKHKPVFSQAIGDNDDVDSSSSSNDHVVKSPEADLENVFWNTTNAATAAAARQPYISPFSKTTLAKNVNGIHTMPPTYSLSSSSKDKSSSSSSQWVQFTPVKGFDNTKNVGRTLTTPFSKRNNKRGSPLLSPLDSDAFLLTPAAKQHHLYQEEEEEDNHHHHPEPKNLFDLSLEEAEDVVEIKIKTKKDDDGGEEQDDDDDCTTVVSGLTKIVEGDNDHHHEPRDLDELAIDGLNSFDIWRAKEVDDDDDDDEGGFDTMTSNCHIWGSKEEVDSNDDDDVRSDTLTSNCNFWGSKKVDDDHDEFRTDTLTSTCDIWGVVVKEVNEDSFDAGDGLLSNFLHNFMVSTPPKKQR